MIRLTTFAETLAELLIQTFESGHKLLICGNGGSAAQSQHMAAELVGKFEHKRKALPAIALTTDTSFLTAWSNDYNYTGVFSRQIEALGKEGDVLIGFSTSGRSKNVLRAYRMAKKMHLIIVDFPRKGRNTAEIQEYQLKEMHKIVRIVEQNFL